MHRLQQDLLVVIVVALSVMVGVGLSACADRPAPLDVTSNQVTGLVVTEGSTFPIGEPLPPPPVNLEEFLERLRAAEASDWDVDTTPVLFVSFETKDGSRYSVQFTPEFPENGVAAFVRPGDGGSEGEWHHLDASGLLESVESLVDETRF